MQPGALKQAVPETAAALARGSEPTLVSPEATPLERSSAVKASVGFYSATGARRHNEDFAAASLGIELPDPRRDVAAAIADGIGSAKGGRVAAETAVRGFLDGMCELSEATEVRRSAARVLNALNGWIHSLGRRDPKLMDMGCSFTALVLRGRTAHIVHVGDTRAYRLSGDRLTCLTTDHVRHERGGEPNTLYRALGVESEVRLEFVAQPMARHDRFLLCSDGVHGSLSDQTIGQILDGRSAAADAARALVASALGSGSSDNCTALVLDVIELPMAESAHLSAGIAPLPILPVPHCGQTIDGFVLKALLSDGRYSRRYAAVDQLESREVVLKFPKPNVADVTADRSAFLREAALGERLAHPGLCRAIELAPGRQTCLYTVMALYAGELLETRMGRRPPLGLEEGRNIAIQLARALAALHREDIIHRDINPDNVILENTGSLKLIDLGAARVRGLPDLPPEEIRDTPAYVAPEMLAGEAGNEATDVYALGVTLFRAFTGEFPYGNARAKAAPSRDVPQELTVLRPDLPAWLEAVLARTIALDPAQRVRDMSEFAMEMESGAARAPIITRGALTLYQRAPLRFWQVIAALLALALLALLLRR